MYCLPLQTGCNYILFVYLPFFFSCAYLCLSIWNLCKETCQSVGTDIVCSLCQNSRRKGLRIVFVLFHSWWKKPWGWMTWNSWEVSGADCEHSGTNIFVRHPAKSSEDTHGEWEEYCTSNVLSLSIKPYVIYIPRAYYPCTKINLWMFV